MFSDEKAKLKKENDKLRKRITSLQRENAKQSGVSSSCCRIVLSAMACIPPSVSHRGVRSFTEGSGLPEPVGE